MIPNLGFLLLASRNAFNDLQSGLITGQGELLTSLSRAWLYLLVPMLLVWFCRIGILGLATAARAVATGLMGKIWICLSLTPLFSDRFASKGHILQFPTLEPNVTQWVGNYAVITAACLAIAIFNPIKQPVSARLNRLLCVLGLITFLFCSVVLNNLGCTIGSGLCIGLIAADLARQGQNNLTDVEKETRTKSPPQRVRLIGFAGLGAALAFAVSNQALLEALRVKHLLIRNDRLEFLAQGFKRFSETSLRSAISHQALQAFRGRSASAPTKRFSPMATVAMAIGTTLPGTPFAIRATLAWRLGYSLFQHCSMA